jgi:hypothetical protein
MLGSPNPARSCVCNHPRSSVLRGRGFTYLLQHLLRVGEVGEHGLDISLVGRPLQETPKGSLRTLHRARWQQLRAATSRIKGEQAVHVLEARDERSWSASCAEANGWLCRAIKGKGDGAGPGSGRQKAPRFKAQQRNTSTTAQPIEPYASARRRAGAMTAGSRMIACSARHERPEGVAALAEAGRQPCSVVAR